MNIIKKATSFAKKHPVYVSTIHAIGGIGLGIIIAPLLATLNPTGWGLALIGISLIGHIYIWVFLIPERRCYNLN